MNDTLPCVSRRGLLKAGLLAVPALAGSQVLAAALSAPDAGAAIAAGSEAAADGYDPSLHDWAFGVRHDEVHRLRAVRRGVQARERRAARARVQPHLDRAPHGDRPTGPSSSTPPRAGSTASRPSPRPRGPTRGPSGGAYFVPRLCMQCDELAVHDGLPGGRHLRDRGRRRPGGRRALHRLRLLRRVVPVRRPLHGAGRRGDAAGRARRRRQVHVLLPPDHPGERPACVEVCPTGTRIFGDLNDPASPVSVVIREQRRP